MNEPMAGVAKHLKGFLGAMASGVQAGPWCTLLQILDPPVKISKSKISITFWIPSSQKGAFYQIVKKKSPEFYAIKNAKKKKLYICSCIFLKKKERQRQPALPTPRRSKNSILIFALFFDFCIRLLHAVRKFQDSWFRSEYWLSYDPKPNSSF